MTMHCGRLLSHLDDPDVVQDTEEGAKEDGDGENDERKVVIFVAVAIQELGPDLCKAQELHDAIPHAIQGFEPHRPFEGHQCDDKLRDDDTSGDMKRFQIIR